MQRNFYNFTKNGTTYMLEMLNGGIYFVMFCLEELTLTGFQLFKCNAFQLHSYSVSQFGRNSPRATLPTQHLRTVQ